MAYLKNLASSLAQRTLPAVAKNIFPNESEKFADFNEKLESAKGILDKAKGDVVNTASGFAGVGPIGKKFAKQLKSGSFGTSAKDEEDEMFKSMGFDPKMFDEQFGGGDPEPDDQGGGETTVNKKINNTFNIKGPIGSSLEKVSKGDAILNERLSYNQAIATNIGRHQIGLLSRIGNELSNISSFLTNNVQAHYETTLSYQQVQTSLSDKLSDALEPMVTYYKDMNEERAKSRAKKETSDGVDDVLNPERMLKKFTDGNFSMLFGDMSPIKGMLSGFSSDPLGTIIAAGLGTAITNVFSKQVDFLKDSMSTLAFKVQGTLEGWASNGAQSGMNMDFIKNKLGNFLKADRDKNTEVQLGKYSKDAISFDGQTKKAIVDVIPMFLSKIHKALTGSKNHEVYDYDKGAFITDHKGVRELQKGLANIDRGNYTGGIGSELKNGLLGDTTMTAAEKRQIQRRLTKEAMAEDAHKKHISTVDLGDETLNAKFRASLAGMSKKDLREMNKAFAGHKVTRSQELEKFQNGLESTGMEQAAILYGGSYGVRKEGGLGRPPLPNPPGPGGGPNPPGPPRPGGGPNPPRPGPNPPRPGPNPPRPGGGPNPPGPVPPIPPGGPSIMDKIKKFLADYSDTAVNGFNKNILNPFKHLLMGKRDVSAEDAANSSLLGSIKSAFSRKILVPFKTMLLGGDKEAAKNTSLMSIFKTKFDKHILFPVKKLMVGEERAGTLSFFDSVKAGFSEKILDPAKNFMLGKDVDRKTASETSFFKSMTTGLDRTVLMPFKRMLVGDKKASRMTFMSAVSDKFNKSILFPVKKAFLGDKADTKTILKTSLMKSIGAGFDRKILSPFKVMLMGGNANKANKMTFFQTLGSRFDKSVLFPLKSALMGSDKSKKDVFRATFFKAISTGFSEKIIQPLNGMLFGADKKKDGFFKNLGTTFSPFFNKLLFGGDKASKFGFVDNLKKEGTKLWDTVWKGAKDRIFTPLTESVKELFGPVFNEFKNVIGDELKYFGGKISESVAGGIKVGAKGLFKSVFGDETVQLLRDNIITPLKDLTSKLTDSMGKVFKFLFRIPVNFMKGITDSMKLQRVKEGRGNYSPEEVARLQEKEKSGKVFDFLDLGPNGKKKDKKDGGDTPAGLFARLGSVLSGKRVKSVGGDGKPTFEADKNSTADNSVKGKIDRILGRIEGRPPLGGGNGSAGSGPIISGGPDSGSNSSKLGGSSSLRGNDKAGGSNGHSNGAPSKFSDPARATAIMASASHRLESSLPAIIKGANASTHILEFAKKNLTKLDARLETIVKLLRKQNGGDVSGVKGSGDFKLFRNPLHWMADKMGGLLSVGTNIIHTALGSLGRVVAAVASIPGKIIGSVVKTATALTKSLLNVVSGAVKFGGEAIKGILSFSAKALVGIGEGLGKVVSGLANATGSLIKGAANFVANIAGPLAKGLATVTNQIIKTVVPMIGIFGNMLVKATKGLADMVAFAATTMWRATKGAVNVAGRMLGRGLGLTSVSRSDNQTTIENFRTLLSESKTSPMHVFVVDGKIQTYARKKARATKFIDNDESRSLLGGDKKILGEDAGKKDSLLGKLFSGLGSLFMANPLGKMILGLGASLTGLAGKLGALLGAKKIGSSLGDLANNADVPDGKRKGKARGRRAGRAGKAGRLGDLARNGLNGKAVPTKNIADELTRLAGRDATKNVAGRATAQLAQTGAKKTGTSLAGRALASVTGSGVGGIAGKLVKGGGIGAAIGIGGGIIADTFFDKGTLGNDLVGDASEYAGYGALAGSIIPGIGTAVGALIGGLVGALKASLPRMLKWVETTFAEEIKGATETFIRIPEMITSWADSLPVRINEFAKALPEKLTSFMDSIPQKISSMFTSDSMKVNPDGTVKEDKPSILGRLFVALGQAIWAIGKAIPKIMVGLMEGLGKTLISAAVAASTGVAKTVYGAVTGLGDMAARTFDVVMIKARNQLPSMLGGLSDEDAAISMKEVDKKYELRAAERTSSLSSIGTAGSNTADFLTDWSIADKLSSGGKSAINEYRDLFKESMASAKGDKEKALQIFKERTQGKMDGEKAANEFKSQASEAENRAANPSTPEIGTNGKYQINKNADGSLVTATKYSSDPGLFTNDDVTSAIKLASEKSGIPVETLNGIAQIESSGRYWVTNKAGYAGLFQMGKDEFAKFSPDPNGSPLDPYLNAQAAANYMSYHAEGLQKRGIPVTSENLYLAHQQGLGGISSIFKAAQGTQPLSDTTRRNMRSNPPGGKVTEDPKEFLSSWGQIVAAKTKQPFTGVAGLSMMAQNGNSGSNGPSAPPIKMAEGNGVGPAPEADMAAKLLNNTSLVAINNMMGGYKYGGQGPLAANSKVTGGAEVSAIKQNMPNAYNASSPEVTANTTTNSAAAISADTARVVNANYSGPTASEAKAEDPNAQLAKAIEAQTSILSQIATNTGKPINFFAGAPAQGNNAPVSPPLVTREDPNAAARRHKALISGDTFPSHLQPGAGASAVAKGGAV